MDALAAYDWPGNVRELKAVMDVAGALAGGEKIGAPHVRRVIESSPRPRRARGAGAAAPSGLPTTRTLRDVVEVAEREHIRTVLRETDGNKTRAARILGVDWKTLTKRLKRYDT